MELPMRARSRARIKSSLVYLLAFLVIVALIFYYYTAYNNDFTDEGVSGWSYAVTKTEEDSSLPPSTKGKKTILMWTKVFQGEFLQLSGDCPIHELCSLTYDRARLPEADAIVFHIPDFKANDLPPLQTESTPTAKGTDKGGGNGMGKEAVRVFMSQETAANLVKYYRLMELPKSYFHWTMTYLNTSDVAFPYGGYWLPPEEALRHGFPTPSLPYTSESILSSKTHRAVFWLVSNCKTASRRELAVRELARHIQVDVAGGCRTNASMKGVCPPSPAGGGVTPAWNQLGASCDSTFDSYPFYIAAENSICRDYITEKYWSRYHLASVPIVMRRDIYEGKVPSGSFIAMSDFPGPEALARHLLYLMDHPAEYLKHFEWRREGWVHVPWNTAGYRVGLCRLCEKLTSSAPPLTSTPTNSPTIIASRNEPTSTATSSSRVAPPVIEDVAQWFLRESGCDNGEWASEWVTKKKGR